MDSGRHTMIVRTHLLNGLLPEADLLSRVIGTHISAADVIGSLVICDVPDTISIALRADRARVEIRTIVLTIVFEHLLLLCCHDLVGRVLVLLMLWLVSLVESVPAIGMVLIHHLRALTRLHHRENLGEALAVLNIDEASQRRFRLLIWQIKFIRELTRAILSDGSLKGRRFHTW